MAAGRSSEFTSPFDDMLDQSRRQFDDLYGGPVAKSPPSPALEAKPEHNGVAPETTRFLDDRYGDRWRYEVVERRREGDEVIVLCKLSVGDGTTRAQFGRAQVGGEASGLSGSAGGVAFTLGTGAAAPGDPEQA
ncbi:MAG: hypothetical protein QF754_14210, partial [Alphaproteobacteria bacterium]|nr:hypothetical protein [Alphaproteobacteria bacterium]